MTRARALAALLTLLALAPIPGSAQEPSWREPVSRLLAARARAVQDRDRAAFADTMSSAPASFRDRSMRWFGRMSREDLATYDLAFARDGFDDLASALPREREDADEVHVVHATERVALRGYDEAPSAEDVFLTVERRGDRWSVVADEDLEDLGLKSSRSLWDFDDVERIERGGVIVLHHDRASEARRILEATLDAIELVRDRWPFRWHRRVVVMIPATAAELERILQTTFDLGPFVAFAASSLDRPDGDWVLSGHRVYVQPSTFFRSSASFQRDVLSHEILHVATRADSGAFVPSWMEEGVAQIYGERAPPGFRELAPRVRSGAFDGHLPDDHRFSTGSGAAIRSAYQASAHFTRYLTRRFDRRAGARLYRALGSIKPVTFGTWRYHLDRAARDVFDRSIRDLERSWAKQLEEEFGG